VDLTRRREDAKGSGGWGAVLVLGVSTSRRMGTRMGRLWGLIAVGGVEQREVYRVMVPAGVWKWAVRAG